MSDDSNEYVPTEEDLVRGFRAPWHSKPSKEENESFAEYMARLSIDSFEAGIADEKAARRGVAKIKADALRDWAKFQEDVLEQHSYAADEEDYEEVQAWTNAVRIYADEVEKGNK